MGMSGERLKKMRKKMKKSAERPHIESLPQDLIVKIVVKLVSSSSNPLLDLKSMHRTSKMFCEASRTKRVGRCIAMEKEFKNRGWKTTRFFAFLRHCAAVGNLEACCILGLIYVYDDKESTELGLICLDMAMMGGHKVATYVRGILKFGRPETQQDGIALLNKLAIGDASDYTQIEELTTSTNPTIDGYRREAASVVGSCTWYRRRVEWERSCTKSKCGRSEGWLDRRWFCSDSCRWSYECFAFHDLI